jgi:mRNA interferase RelE/StbE
LTDEHRWHLQVAASAERSLQRLPEKVVVAVVEFVTGPLLDEPRRVGHPLQNEWWGAWTARRGPYRVIYEIDDVARSVHVLRIEHRADVYRSR